jgi:hypothetical protein
MDAGHLLLPSLKLVLAGCLAKEEILRVLLYSIIMTILRLMSWVCCVAVDGSTAHIVTDRDHQSQTKIVQTLLSNRTEMNNLKQHRNHETERSSFVVRK